MKPVGKSAARSATSITANNCPIGAMCAVRKEKSKAGWVFCGHWGGSEDVNKDLMVVFCRCPEECES